MKPIVKILFFLIVAHLIGCNQEKSADANPPAQPQALAAQVDALNKAKQVGQVLEDGAGQERQTINQQTQ